MRAVLEQTYDKCPGVRTDAYGVRPPRPTTLAESVLLLRVISIGPEHVWEEVTDTRLPLKQRQS